MADSGNTDWEILSVKVQPDLYDQIQEHKDEQDHATNSENVRDLFKKGLEASENQGEITREIVVAWIGTVLIASAIDWNVNTDWIVVLGFVLIIGVVAYNYVRD